MSVQIRGCTITFFPFLGNRNAYERLVRRRICNHTAYLYFILGKTCRDKQKKCQ